MDLEMKFNFTIDDIYKPLIEKQITQYAQNSSIYLEISEQEYKMFIDYIEIPTKVLELGCGLGRMSIYLYHQLQRKRIYYILADSSSNTKHRLLYGWNKYMDDLIKITTPNCIMVFGVRKNRYNEETFNHLFRECYLIENKSKKSKEDILILKGKY